MECTALLPQDCVSQIAGTKDPHAERVYILSEAPVPLSLHGSVHVFIDVLYSGPSVQQMQRPMYGKKENLSIL